MKFHDFKKLFLCEQCKLSLKKNPYENLHYDGCINCAKLFAILKLIKFKQFLVKNVLGLVYCSYCQSTGETSGTGGIKERCNNCRIGKRNKVFSKFGACFNWFEGFVKLHCFIISLVFFFGMLSILYYFRHTAVTALVVTSFGFIFVALKYRLDQANYHKDLFKERFEIISILNGVLRDYAPSKEVTHELIERISGDFLIKSYSLFNSKTYDLIKMVRQSLIEIQTFKPHEADYLKNGSPNENAVLMHNNLVKAELFMAQLMDEKFFFTCFPEFKINSY